MVRPEEAQGAGDFVGELAQERVDFRGREPAAFADLGGVEVERAGDRAEDVDLDELVAGFGRRGKFQERAKGQARVVPADFLAKLAPGGSGIILARVKMAAAGGIPATGKGVLAHAAALEKKTSRRVVDHDVRGAVNQVLRVDFAAGRAADDAVLRVDDVEEFVRIGGDGTGSGHGRKGQRITVTKVWRSSESLLLLAWQMRKIIPFLTIGVVATVAVIGLLGFIASVVMNSKDIDSLGPVDPKTCFESWLEEPWPDSACVDFLNSPDCLHGLVFFHFKGKVAFWDSVLKTRAKMRPEKFGELRRVYGAQFDCIAHHLPDDIASWDAYTGGLTVDGDGTFVLLFVNTQKDEALVVAFQIM